MNPALPNSLSTILQLAAILILLTATLGTLLSVLVTGRKGLTQLGFQFSLLLFALYAAQDWVYPLVFSTIFDGVQQFSGIAAALCIMTAAFSINMMLKAYVWDGHLFGHDAPVPQLLAVLVQGMIYLIAVLIVLQFVYGQSITALATLSGAAAVILGFSAQSTLGEMFAGIAISVSRPFKVGDWIKIGETHEGKVVDQTWRHVQIRMWDGCTLNVPNRVIAESTIKNLSSGHGRRICLAEVIRLDPEMAPDVATKMLLSAIRQTHAALEEPGPEVFYRGMKNGKAEYIFGYFIDDYGARLARNDKLWRAIAKAFPEWRDDPLPPWRKPQTEQSTT
ncbi:mechanosensitive ion channel family protein [Phyllobacterium lublinensis]|uniref:mechanosensitive ion channel family protein n=1 Tax=Phyllobacterium lublinensis TaxID=2875708 RepID=UPI001CCBEA7C|nr:mechanosensitive ion channel family protein [Phyllobacterium sp. 2063]MBZ9654304.1 mechanosensitive ion channel family protein [Phyllobacterium sp. 2063]